MAQHGQGADIAAKSLFTAASAANAIPVAGQFASAGLAIAGLFTKLFGGRRRAKRQERKRQQEKRTNLAQEAAQTQVQATRSANVGQQTQGPVGATAPVQTSEAPAFSTYGGGSAPPIQQRVLNNSIGFNS